jgi:hypothetical protein
MPWQPDLDPVPRCNRQQLLDFFLGRRWGRRRPLRHWHADLEEHLSNPAGATEISIFAGLSDSFLNECGVPTGMLANIPAVATCFLPLIVNAISPSRT